MWNYRKGKMKGFVWVWMERIAPKKPRVPQPAVVAVRVASLEAKEFLLSLDPNKFFTEPHYDGFPAVLVRLPVGSDSYKRVIFNHGIKEPCFGVKISDLQKIVKRIKRDYQLALDL